MGTYLLLTLGVGCRCDANLELWHVSNSLLQTGRKSMLETQDGGRIATCNDLEGRPPAGASSGRARMAVSGGHPGPPAAGIITVCFLFCIREGNA